VAIAYDSTAGHSVAYQGVNTSAPFAVTVTIVAGQTAVLVVNTESSINTISSISGGGTWTRAAGPVKLSFAEVEIWTTGAGAATSAASITLTPGGAVTAEVLVVQYTGVGSIKTSGALTNSGFSTADTVTPTISLTPSKSTSWVVAGFGLFDETQNNTGGTKLITANTGNLRKQLGGGSFTEAALTDNTGSGSVTNSINYGNAVGDVEDWVAAAVELAVPVDLSNWQVPELPDLQMGMALPKSPDFPEPAYTPAIQSWGSSNIAFDSTAGHSGSGEDG
jgi:hypothetical protein